MTKKEILRGGVEFIGIGVVLLAFAEVLEAWNFIEWISWEFIAGVHTIVFWLLLHDTEANAETDKTESDKKIISPKPD